MILDTDDNKSFFFFPSQFLRYSKCFVKICFKREFAKLNPRDFFDLAKLNPRENLSD